MPFAFKVFIGVILLIVTLALMGHYQVSVSVSFDTLFHIVIVILLIIAIRRQSDIANRLGKNQKALAAKLDKLSNVIK